MVISAQDCFNFCNFLSVIKNLTNGISVVKSSWGVFHYLFTADSGYNLFPWRSVFSTDPLTTVEQNTGYFFLKSY